MSGTVTDALNYWSRSVPNLPAIDFDGDVVTYSELAGWADGVAHDLASRGVSPGDRVSFLGANSLEWAVASLGAMKVGAIAVGFNHRMLAGELTTLVEDCEPKVVYCDEALLPRLEEVQQARNTFRSQCSKRTCVHCAAVTTRSTAHRSSISTLPPPSCSPAAPPVSRGA